MADTALGDRRAMLLRHVGFAVLVLGTWEVYGRLGNPLILPPASGVFAALADMTFGGPLPAALWSSVKLLTIGFAVALASGFLLGVIVGRYKTMDRTLGPFLNALYATPTIALVPIVLVWFGFELTGRVVVVFLASFFPVLINVYAGVRDAPLNLIEVARSFGVGSEFGLLRRVVIPAATPFIMAGIRLGIGRGVVGMAVAEVYLRLGGIGALIVQYGASFQTDFLLAAILPLPLLGIGLTKLFAYVERHYQYWRTV
ncbi:MAG: ABC transporter permease [Egibacteraceae bacterium]